MIYKTFKTATGILLILVGVILTPMPIPIGIILILCGIALLATVSQRVRRWITRIRKRFPGFSRSLSKSRPRLPATLRRLLDETEPTNGSDY